MGCLLKHLLLLIFFPPWAYTRGGGAYTWEKLAMEKMMGLYMGGGGGLYSEVY